MRKLALMIAALALFCLSGAAFAQDMTPHTTYCGDLSDADCQILTQAETAMPSLDSATFDLNMDLTLSNLPDMPNTASITVVGNGAYSGVAALHSDMQAMMTDYAAALQNVFDNFDGQLTLTITIPPELMDQADPGAPNSLTLDLLLVDGVGYINLDELQPVLNDPSFKGWGGLDIANFLRDALAQNPDLFNMSGMNQGMNPMDYAKDFQDPAFISQFVSISRTDDGTGNTATFETTVDFAALMSSPEFQNLMMQQLESQGSTMSSADTEQMMAMMQQMYQGMTMTITQVISTDTYYTQSVSGAMHFDSATMMNAVDDMSATPVSPDATPEAAPVIDLTFAINYANFNSAPAITAPDNVSMLPYQMFLGMMPTPEATMAAMTPTATTESMMTPEPTAEMTMEPTVEVTGEMTMEPTAEVTETPIVVTPEVTAEMTAEATVSP